MHPYARWIGSGWMVIGVIVYFVFRARNRLPLIRTAKEIRVLVD